MRLFAKETRNEAIPATYAGTVISAARYSAPSLSEGPVMDEDSDDPLSRAQVLASIRAAKRLHLPTGDVLRAVRRQIDED